MPRKKAVPASAEAEATKDQTDMENMDIQHPTEGAENMDYESMINDSGGTSDAPADPGSESAQVSVETFDESDFPDEPEPDNAAAAQTEPQTATTAPAQETGRQRPQNPTSDRVLTLEVGAEARTQREIDNTIWHEIKNSQVTGSPLSGILGKVEQLESGALISIIDYKGQRIAIPLREMMLNVNRPPGQSDDEYNERVARVLNRMMGAEVDFVVRGITGADKGRAAVASRKAAMLRLRRRYYLNIGTNGKPLIYPDRIVEARIVAVSSLAIRVEVFGVETAIRNRELSWGYVGDCRDEYFVGNTVQVRVRDVYGDTPENLEIKADVKSLTDDDTREKLKALKPQTNCIGKVTDVRGGIIFLVLIDGVRAIAHKCFDKRNPGRGDDVMFVCTHIDEQSVVAQGIVPRIIKRNL
jgi:hypothetical protein